MILKNKLTGKKLLYLFFIPGIIFYSALSTAQDLKVKSTEWLALNLLEYVDISYRYDECSLPSQGTEIEYVYLKFTNKTDQVVQIEWKTEVWYNGKCSGCKGGNTAENNCILLLKPLETKEGLCSELCDPKLRILSRILNFDLKKELTDFKLSNLKIVQLEN